MSGQLVMADAVERRECAQTGGARVGEIAARRGALGDDQKIFGGVLGRDELEDLGLVAGPFEKLGAPGRRSRTGLAFLENAVAQRVGEDGWHGELGPDFLLAARRDHEQARTGGDALGEGIVRPAVSAGVECDQNVERIFGFAAGPSAADAVGRALWSPIRPDVNVRLEVAVERATWLQRSTSSGRASKPVTRARSPKSVATANVR